EGAVLCLRPGTYPVVDVVKKSVTLRGLGVAPDEVVLDGGGRGTVLRIGGKDPQAVTIEHLTITGGARREGGGGIQSAGGRSLDTRFPGRLGVTRSVVDGKLPAAADATNRIGPAHFAAGGAEPWRPRRTSPAVGLAHRTDSRDVTGRSLETTAGALAHEP